MGDNRFRGSARAILVLALLAVVLAGCASSRKKETEAAAGAAPPGTSTVEFKAYAADGSLAVSSTRTVRGQCWTTSIAAPDADAFRCFQGNNILDPCFAPKQLATPPVLACLTAPWSKAIVLHVTGKLPASADGTAAARPWAFQFDSGVRCVASTGTVPSVGGVNLAYRCTDGGNAALAGPSGGELTAKYAPPGGSTVTTMTVATVWNA